MPLNFERPSPRYMRELEEVARDANELSDLILKANRLPDKFPTEAISILCMGLAALPDGTAEGSIGILTHAHSRLPSWRNEYLDFAEDPDKQGGNELGEPVARRGERLDDAIKGLYASVGSAIECYKLESGSEIEADLEPESDLPADVDIGRESALEAVDAMRDAAADLQARIHTSSATQAKDMEVSNRILTDVQNQAHAGRSELILPAPRPTILERLAAVGEKVLVFMENAEGWALTAGLAIHGYGMANDDPSWFSVARLVEGAGKSLGFAAKEIRKLKAQAEAKKLNQDNPSKNTSPPFDLAEAHAMILRGEAPPKAWVPFITHLSFIREFSLSNISVLSGLTALQSLDLCHTQVSDVSALSDLTALKRLDLSYTGVNDISPLNSLVALKSLNLTKTHVREVNGLRELTALHTLHLSETNISDVVALSGLLALEFLSLERTVVSDISPLSHLNKLQELNLAATSIKNISVLKGFPLLETLSLTFTLVMNLSAISGLRNLKSISLNEMYITDISALRELTNLEHLELRGSRVKDYSVIKGFVMLKNLNLRVSMFHDVAILTGLKSLQKLDLLGAQVRDISPLDRLVAAGLAIVWR